MSPSHQVRVKRNNCEHDWVVYTTSENTYRRCTKCGKNMLYEHGDTIGLEASPPKA